MTDLRNSNTVAGTTLTKEVETPLIELSSSSEYELGYRHYTI
jgi:hypothetical protein